MKFILLLSTIALGLASALLPAPVADLTLDDKQRTTGLLLRAGATIHELNAVRKHLSRLKGGGLAAEAAPARVVTLILSDVVGDDLSTIASGQGSPYFSSRCFSRLPAFTPMRMGTPRSPAAAC